MLKDILEVLDAFRRTLELQERFVPGRAEVIHRSRRAQRRSRDQLPRPRLRMEVWGPAERASYLGSTAPNIAGSRD